MRIFRGATKVGDPPGRAEIPDVDLLQAHVAGDPHAFETLLSRHYDHLWHVALRTSYTPEDAADALQDALLSAHRAAARFRRDAAVRSWLHTIVVNACLDRIRRNRNRPTVSLSTDDAQDPPVRRDHIAERELAVVVERALTTLPDDQRLAIVAVDLEGRSTAEASALLGIPEGTVKSRCARARKKLALTLEYFREEGNRQ
ncbi:RNA polymerase sigma factor SigM [Rhodococcus triatomae]|uniref:RNA polymerase sigma-70 factor, ECF subfamily n=1 Tax=Rhodococcus triatomae TaxID=300028 RepID=A0A1G8R227_9NOCA|nr:RNA polymerase sigma factor SigM [Rhodococcus triatomae]QNG20732.1 RNA polymerase sigma factor SigM [Rhodococcus triatomae]QNG23351.1 RNA polymerase sigma factor SigM [Rhodococcus triatomae]SDJ10460.1 RNA polymerase sigma-70 factor, ECF subfamily [Rhodococcus triatomae]